MTTKRRVLLDGNGSTKINVDGLGVYVPAIEHDHLKQKLSAEIQQLKDQRNAMQVDLEIAVKTAETLKTVTAEREQLASELEEVKALLVDAIGDGWYDGYLACKNYVSNEHFDIDTVKDSDVLQWSQHYESEHRYSKSISDIRAKAVMKFAEVPQGAYLSGFVTAELTVYDVYQSARNHVKDNYGYETNPWTGEDADKAKAATCEIIALALESINHVEFVAMALRHTTVSGDFDYQDVKDAFKLLADEYRQAAKDGA